MLNDRSSALTLLETRRSSAPRELTGAGPTPAEMEQILTIAARTPDHGQLCPWRFITVATDQREMLQSVLLVGLAESDPSASDASRQKERDFAHYAGQLVVLVSAPAEDHKIPLWEQQLSCGAAAMNLMLGAHALGYVAGWVTGRRAYAPSVRRAFCGPGEQIAGFIFIGNPGAELEERPRPDLADVSEPWRPES
ncbi:MAG: nitroreductase [Sphingomicrobium sp.]